MLILPAETAGFTARVIGVKPAETAGLRKWFLQNFKIPVGPVHFSTRFVLQFLQF